MLDPFLARGLRLPRSPGRLMLCLIYIIYGLGDMKRYQTYTLRHQELLWNARGMFPNRAIMDLNDSIFQALAPRCFQKPRVLSLS